MVKDDPPVSDFASGLAGWDTRLLLPAVAAYRGSVFKGAEPADLPIEQPTEFDFVLNLETAKTFGLTLPQPLVSRADQVIP